MGERAWTRAWRGLCRWWDDRRGQALTEYGLSLALIAIAVIVILGQMGGRLEELFTNVTNSIRTTPGSAP
jgi:pilus assembly protein Flp/PilA